MKKEVTSLTGEQEAGVENKIENLCENQASHILNEEKQSEEQQVDVPIDEVIDESVDVLIDDAIDEPVDVPTDEAVDATIDEAIAEAVDAPIDDVIDEPVDVPTDEAVDALIDEVIDEAVDALIDEVINEAVDTLIDEVIDEVVDVPIDEAIDEPVDATIDEVIDEPAEEILDKPRKKYKKIVIGIIAVICTILFLYLGITAYFINHFYLGSEINGINISGKTVKGVEELMKADLEAYTLDLKERSEKIESIKASEVGLKYDLDTKFKKLKEGQTPFGWFSACFNTKGSEMTVGVVYDEKLLENRLNKLSCFNSRYIIEPKNPSFKYVDNNYIIVDEILGNKVDKDSLNAHVSQALLNREAEIDLELLKSYINPQYTTKSQKIIEVKHILNNYASSMIIYTFGNSKEVIDGSIINKWLRVDENFRVTIDKKKIEDYIEIIFRKHNTIVRTRDFVTSSGKSIQISGGDFVRSIDKVKETQSLVLAIEGGRTLTKDSIYCDIGNTYVEIDLTDQHLWFYKNNSLIVEGDVVTGDVRRNRATPKGIYSLKYKAENAVLRGPGYAAPVKFWMPFNNGIGMHDANWRSSFGGNIYKSNGSHGCINCPYKLVKKIYNDIELGASIICY